mgnify:CR=1 FL=1
MDVDKEMKSFKQYISEAPKGVRMKGWGNAKNGKVLLTPIKGRIKPYHTEFAANNLRKMGIREDDVIDAIMDATDGVVGKRAFQNVKDGKVDRMRVFQEYLYDKGWYPIVLDNGMNSISDWDSDAKAKDLHKISVALDKKYGDSLWSSDENWFEFGGEFISNKYDWNKYIKTKRIPGSRTAIGKTMAQFREAVATKYGHTLWIDPKGEVHDMGSRYVHFDWISINFKRLFGREPRDRDDVFDTPMEKGWIRVKNRKRVIDLEADSKLINRKQKKAIDDIYYSRGNLDLKIYIDHYDLTTTSRAKDKMYRGEKEVARWLKEEYLTEKPTKISATFPYRGAGWSEFRGLENPTERELVAFLKKAKRGDVRFTVDSKGKMWAWDGDHGLHDEVIFGMTGQKYNGDYAKGIMNFVDLDDSDVLKIKRDGNLKIIIMNTRTVGTDHALKNRTLKSIARRINSKDQEKRVYWKDM